MKTFSLLEKRYDNSGKLISCNIIEQSFVLDNLKNTLKQKEIDYASKFKNGKLGDLILVSRLNIFSSDEDDDIWYGIVLTDFAIEEIDKYKNLNKITNGNKFRESPGLMMKNFSHGDFIEFYNTASPLDGVVGKIVGKPVMGLCDFYIVDIKEPVGDRPDTAILITEACIKKV